MKCLMIACIFLTSAPGLLAQDWIFAGALTHTDEGLVNAPATKYGYSWIRADDNKAANMKLFKAQIAKMSNTKDFTRESSKFKFIAIYKHTRMGARYVGKPVRYSYYVFYAGKDLAAIEHQLAKDTKAYDILNSEQVELFDMEKKKQELNAQSSNPVIARAIQ